MTSLTASAATVYIQVKEISLREEPRAFAKALTVLRYGEAVETVESQQDWVRVKTAKAVEGWLRMSVFSKKKPLALAADASGPSASASRVDEANLAARGFDKSVEDAMKRKNPELRLDKVDAMERFDVSAAQLQRFLSESNLTWEEL